MTASSPTNVPAHITLSAEDTNAWKVTSESCLQLRLRPIRILKIGRYGLQLCDECVQEFRTAIATEPTRDTP